MPFGEAYLPEMCIAAAVERQQNIDTIISFPHNRDANRRSRRSNDQADLVISFLTLLLCENGHPAEERKWTDELRNARLESFFSFFLINENFFANRN